MNELVTDPGLRNWIKACLGLKYVRDGMLPYLQRKCEDVYANNETFTKTITKLTTYSCSVCCVKNVKPNHSMNNCPAKGQLGGKTKCACTSKKKQLCPNGGACGVMYDRIMDDHVSMAPRWDNSDCQKWYLNGWEQLKCFIDIPGYKNKALISQADVTAFVHICQNNKTLYTIFKSHLGKLIQVRSDRNEIYHSGDLDLTDDKLKEYLANMKAVLKIAVFNAFTSDIQEQLDKLAKLEADVGIEVNTVTEIEARKEALNALIEDTKMLEYKSDLSIQQAKFAVLQDNHMRSIADRLKGIKKEFNLCAKVLLEQSSELKSITAGVHANTKAFEALQRELVQQSELIRGIEVTTVKTNIVVTKSYKTLKDVECDVKTILLIFKEILKYNTPHARNINGTIVAEIKEAANEKHLSNEIVQAIHSQKFNPDQEASGDIDTVLKDVIKAVETDGDEIIDVRPGSILIKILCQSMSNWINLCEKCIDGRMTQRFKPLQDHLRKKTSLGNLTITVDMLETDFIESVDNIVKQLYPYMIAALPHNMEMHRADGIENINVQHMNAMLKCLLEKSHQYSHQKPRADINRAQGIKFPEMQIDNGQTTCVTVDQTCMETKTDQNITAPTSETLSVQNTFSGTDPDLNIKENELSADLEACGRKICRAGSSDSDYPQMMPHITLERKDTPTTGLKRHRTPNSSISLDLKQLTMDRLQDTESSGSVGGTKSLAQVEMDLIELPSEYQAEMEDTQLKELLSKYQAEMEELRGFPNVIGVIDCTHVKVLAPREYEADYVNRKGYHSLNVQMVCDSGYRFLNVVAKWPENVHDARIFRNSLLCQHLENDDVAQPKIKQSNDDMPYHVRRRRHSDGSLSIPSLMAQLLDLSGYLAEEEKRKTMGADLKELHDMLQDTESSGSVGGTPSFARPAGKHRIVATMLKELRYLKELHDILQDTESSGSVGGTPSFAQTAGKPRKVATKLKELLSKYQAGIEELGESEFTPELAALDATLECARLHVEGLRLNLIEQDCIKMTHDGVTGKCNVQAVKTEFSNASGIVVVEKEKSAFKDVPL